MGDTIPRRGHVVGEMARTRRVKKVFSDGWLASYARSLERRDALRTQTHQWERNEWRWEVKMTNSKLATRRLARLPARIRAGDDETPPPRGRIVVHGEHVCGRAVQFTAQLKRLPSYSMVVLCLPGL